MFAYDEELSVMDLFKDIKLRYPRFHGSDYIYELWILKGKFIHPTELYHICHGCEDSCPNPIVYQLYYAGYDTYLQYQSEIPIPLCDAKALHMVRTAVQTLLSNLELAKINNDLGAIEEYETELEQLKLYLRENLTPQGHIRTINNMTRDHARLIRHAIANFYQKIAEPYPELCDYLCHHVVIGVKCYWSINPISKGKYSRS